MIFQKENVVRYTVIIDSENEFESINDEAEYLLQQFVLEGMDKEAEKMTSTREMLKRAENFKAWLVDNGYKTETSGCFDCVHFEIYIEDHERFLEANRAIDEIVCFDMI